MIRTIIIEDEIAAQDALKHQLDVYCPEVQVVDIADTVQKGLATIEKHQPELLILDIKFPDGTAFDLLEKLNYRQYNIIFITAFSSYAEKAFKYCAIHYLLKPIITEDLIDAINRVKKELLHQTDARKIEFLLHNMKPDNPSFNKIGIGTSDAFHFVSIPDILFCKADGYCTKIKLKNGKDLCCTKNLKHYEELLRPHNFIRVHHSYIINLNHVIHYSKDGIIYLQHDAEVPLGETYRQYFIKYLKIFRQ